MAELYTTGAHNVALGVDAKVKLCGSCNHPNKREVNRDCLNGLTISKRDWTHCVFYRFGGCVYAGECEHKEDYNNG